MKAMIFAAGLGTRLKPFTENHPKALAIVNGKTLLERNIQYLKSFGINDIVINIHHFGQQIIDFLKYHNYFDCQIEISDEREAVLETGGGLKKAEPFLQENSFLLMNVDILTDLDLNSMIRFHEQYQPLVSLAVSDRNSSRKLFFSNNSLVGWSNLTSGDSVFKDGFSLSDTDAFAFSGIHVVNPKLFKLMQERGKYSIIKTYLDIMETQNILGYKHSAQLIDVGKPESIQEAEKYFA
ncbi:nucleotidyltransferase family protein [Apibacter raozihei]|uniref:nucleotidyltransferase family protein n=1 Tax=Apibacter raozihei TaxID=2500547 RepID=UPI000FE3AFFF|nr:nucleotidyltransferase family protein [Apibacter raozihei]